MKKLLLLVTFISTLLLLSACSTPVIKLQYVSQPQPKLSSFGDIDIQTFADRRTNNLQKPTDRISYQEILKSDNMTSEFLQSSEGVGSSIWYYTTDPKLEAFLQSVMLDVGQQSGFIDPNSSKHYAIQGFIHNLSIKMEQTKGIVTVNVKFTGILRKDNGTMLMIMPIDYDYVSPMTQPIADKSQTAPFNNLIDNALSAASLQMYQMIEENFPAFAKAPARQASGDSAKASARQANIKSKVEAKATS